MATLARIQVAGFDAKRASIASVIITLDLAFPALPRMGTAWTLKGLLGTLVSSTAT
jgi:hypothetical protein